MNVYAGKFAGVACLILQFLVMKWILCAGKFAGGLFPIGHGYGLSLVPEFASVRSRRGGGFPIRRQGYAYEPNDDARRAHGGACGDD